MQTMLSALFVFPPEFKMILKERASGMYQISSYYLARTSSGEPPTKLEEAPETR